MEPQPTANYAAAHSPKPRLFSGGTSFYDPDVVEVSSSSASWGANRQKRKVSQVILHNIIEIDEDDEPAVVIIGESSGNKKHKQVVGYDGDWQKQITGVLAKNLIGSSTYPGSENDFPLDPLQSLEPDYDYDYAHSCEYDDYGYSENGFVEYDNDIDIINNDCNYNLAAKFDDFDLPPGVEATVPVPWLQKPALEKPSKIKKAVEDEIDIKFKQFKQFDTVQDYSDHHFLKPENVRATSVAKKPPKDWAKRIQHEWKVLEKDLPETIFVRVYEERMDLLRAVIVGPAGTPYHDGLFFFDVFFPSSYPNVPPLVHYHSGGLRLNPNLYACGKVCLSLLGTWTGQGCEKWSPGKSTMLQVLVSIQALVLNAKPYFNEPGFANTASTPHGERKSLAYNEETFLLSCKTMLYSLRRPPKNFEDFVSGHFRKLGHTILVACRSYMDGAQVGCVVGEGVQDVDEGDKSCSSEFKILLKGLYKDLLMELTVKVGDCDAFLQQKVEAGAAEAYYS